MEPFQTLWTCLVSKPASSQPNISLEKSESIKPTKLFAKALNEVCDIALSQLPHSIIKMCGFSITIPEDEYLIRVKACKHNLYWFFGLKVQNGCQLFLFETSSTFFGKICGSGE
ncbi:unnamed protein product [Lathyrus oleraceus]